MSFGLNEFAKEVHQNAVDHGFWDDDATDERQIALIHSEWSEALQADRSGCTPREVCMELIDGVLRVLDYCAAKGLPVGDEEDWNIDMEIFHMICELHYLTARAYLYVIDRQTALFDFPWSKIYTSVFSFCRYYGIDPYELMQEKYQYNLTRPHKHGKRY